jgi:steroid delta-isomerase-like uncharacterized protein
MTNRGILNLEEELVTSHADSQTLVRSSTEEIYNARNLNLEEQLVTDHIDSQTLVRSAIEQIYNRGNLNLADEIAASHYVAHDSTFTDTGTGSMGLKNHAKALRTAFPDLHLNIEDMHSDGETVTTRLTAQGTHKGTLLNVRATGRSVTTTGILVSHVTNGKLTETFMNWDALGVLQQLGAVQSLGQTKAVGAS